MKNKIFLSSMLIMSVAPAMAEDFPTNGLMQENKTYDNAATETNMAGVYEGSVNATAEYETINYLLNAGQYLPADSETITTCPSGSFCSGIGNVNYNQTTPQGIQTCPSGFSSSALGSSSNTQCYRACDINNMGDNGSIANIAHATAISGNDYYGSGTDTCEPTACENGYHVGGLDVVFKTPIVPIDYNDAATDYGHISADGENTYQSTNYGLTNNNTWAAEYEDGTIVSGRASCQATPTSDNQALLYIGSNLGKVQSGEMQFSELKAGVAQLVGNEKANWAENLFNQMMTGQLTEAQASVKLAGMFNINEDANYATNSTGQYCYCQMTGYTPNGGTMHGVFSPWVFGDVYGTASDCAGNCAFSCANTVRDTGSSNLAFRAALLGSVQPTAGRCDANIININWSDVDPEYAGQNNENTATYGSDVRTPVKAQAIKGKTFRGWRFSKPTETTTGGN